MSERGYTGHLHHAASGLIVAPFRVYDAQLKRWLSEDPIQESGGPNLYAYVGNGPIGATDPLGLVDWGGIGSAVKLSYGLGLNVGVRKVKLGPINVRGPSLGVALKHKFDLAGGSGVVVDSSAQLISASVGEYAVGLGAANESGYYTEYDCDKAEVVDDTEKVLGFSRGDGSWDSSSPYTLEAEVGALVNAGIQIDFGQIWSSLWK